MTYEKPSMRFHLFCINAVGGGPGIPSDRALVFESSHESREEAEDWIENDRCSRVWFILESETLGE